MRSQNGLKNASDHAQALSAYLCKASLGQGVRDRVLLKA